MINGWDFMLAINAYAVLSVNEFYLKLNDMKVLLN